MKKLISLLACGTLVVSSFPPGAFAEGTEDGKTDITDVIEIATAADFAELAKNCSFDGYSKGKTFRLTSNIDISRSSAETVPYFAGTFDGGGYTISGVRIMSDGSAKGLFRYTGAEARITDLNVEGRVLPGGTGNSVGGIVGENSGELVRCSFSGKVSGIRCVGGIAGVNTATGIINACKTDGESWGEHSIGGIAGENSGIITECTNSADINNREITVTEEKTFGFNMITDIAELKKDASDISEEKLLNISDIGGIVGHSTGTAEDCVNTGRIGYEHMGYNVGGIAGRSSGRIARCENSGAVLGRKDAGGIAGQIEPFACWDFSDSKVTELQSELDGLQSKIDAMIDNGEDKSADVRSKLAEMNSELTAARAEFDRLKEQTRGDISASELTLNQMRDIINDYLGKVSESAEELDKYAGEAKEAIGKIASDTAGSVKNEIDKKQNQANDIITQANDIMARAVDDTGLAEYSSMISGLSEKLRDDPNNAKAAELMSLLKSVADDETQLHLDLREQVRLIRSEIETGDIEGLINSLQELKSLKQDYAGDERIDKMLTLMQELELPQVDIDIFRDYADNMRHRAAQFATDIDALVRVLSQTKELFKVEIPEVNTTEITKLIDSLYGSINTDNEKELISRLKEAASGMNFTVPDLNELFKHLRRAGEIASDLSDKAITDQGISGEINDIRDSFNSVIDCFSGTVDDVSTIKTKYEKDISDSGERSTNGTVKDCVNSAEINGDNNVGGIVGTMAFELEFDAEDQLNLSQYVMTDARYLIYTVIDGCTDSGDVFAKKDSAGGIVGNMDFGTVSNCVSMGMISVKNGDNCGGTAGRSLGKIRNCAARTVLDGGKYVGGIAGYAATIEDCLVYSFVDSAKEYVGSAAGFAEGSVTGCYFVDNGVGGIDGVSKAGIAEPLEYADMIKRSDVPEEFKKITLTFIAEDGSVVGELEVPFGGTVEKSQLPAVEKSGEKFWKWDDSVKGEIYYSMAVHGEYVDPITTLATEGDIPMLLAEGSFFEGQALTVEQTEQKGTDSVSYRVSVSDNTAPLKVRYRSDIIDGELLVNGVRQKYERDGSCIVFNIANGQSFVYRETEKSGNEELQKQIYIGSAAAIVVIFVIVKVVKARKKQKNRVTSK